MTPASDIPSWQVLVGSFGIERIEAELATGTPLLLVPNNLDRAAQLAKELERWSSNHLFLCHELLSSEDGEICWYRYNDERFDGCSPPEVVQRSAPNVLLRDLELRRVSRLDSLIHGWANHDPTLAAQVAAGGGRIWLRCKQPEPIVAGSLRLVNVIAEIRWTPLGSFLQESETAALAELLEPSLFHPLRRAAAIEGTSHGDLVWLQDPLRLARYHQQQLEEQCSRQHQENVTLIAETQALLQQLDALQGEKAELEAGNEVCRQELDTLRAEQIALRDQHAGQGSWISELESRVRALETLSEEALAEIDAVVALLGEPPGPLSQD